jgi:hypothetical protein
VNLESTVRSIARRLRLVRAADAAVRWAFVASAVGFAALVASGFGLWNVSGWATVGGIGAAAAAGAAVAAGRAPTPAQAARHLDRTLGLEERVATALEARGPLAELQRADACRALQAADRSRVARFVLSTEGKLLPLLFALLAGALLARTIRPEPDPAAAAPSEAQLEALRWIAPTAQDRAAAGPAAELQVRLARISARIAAGERPVEALDALAREAYERIARDPKLGPGEIGRLRQIGRAARGAAAALGRRPDGAPSRPWDLSGPEDPSLKHAFDDSGDTRRHASARPTSAAPAPGPSGRPLPVEAGAAATGAPRARSSDYDAVVTRYFAFRQE